MIRIILRGRTGNILFQYALGRMLAAKHGVPLVLDASWYNSEGWREVSCFLKLPLQAKVVRRLPLAARAMRRYVGKHYWEYRGVPVLRECADNQSFDPLILDAPSDCVIYGYFQSPRYFASIASELRDEVTDLLEQTYGPGASQDSQPTATRPSSPTSLIQELSKPNSVAVHVRRGDYLKLPAFRVCDASYYLRAINDMRSVVETPRFHVFSDDPQWCRETFIDQDMEVIENSAANLNPLHDLHLMSLASHHVIANSSYSWWAAWLGDKPDQRVIMPERWFAQDIIAPIEEKRWK